jgi:hypothetical protein
MMEKERAAGELGLINVFDGYGSKKAKYFYWRHYCL